MQRGTFGKAMRDLVAIGTLVTALAMFACGGDSDTKDVPPRLFDELHGEMSQRC